MATITIPSTFVEDNFRRNLSGGSWLAPVKEDDAATSLPAGRTTDGTVYRAYIKVPGQSNLTQAMLNSITLNAPRYDSYAAKTIQVGLCNSVPSQTITSSGFDVALATDLVVASGGTLTVNITPEQWGDPTDDKYIVILGNSNNTYLELAANSSNWPKVTIDYDDAYVYIGNGSGFDKYEVYIGNGTTWERYAPYIGNGTSWDPCG